MNSHFAPFDSRFVPVDTRTLVFLADELLTLPLEATDDEVVQRGLALAEWIRNPSNGVPVGVHHDMANRMIEAENVRAAEILATCIIDFT